MQRIFLIGVGAFSLVNASYMWTVTQHWYDTIPGVVQTGPLNIHFARDVALAFLSSGMALIWAGGTCDRTAGFCGTAWLMLHAVYHVWIWIHRGVPLDVIALTNFAGILLPAGIAFWAALTLREAEAGQ